MVADFFSVFVKTPWVGKGINPLPRCDKREFDYSFSSCHVWATLQQVRAFTITGVSRVSVFPQRLQVNTQVMPIPPPLPTFQCSKYRLSRHLQPKHGFS